LEEELDKDAVCCRFYSTCTPNLTKEAPEGFGGFKIEEQVIHTVKYADDLVLLAKEEAVLHGMKERLIAIGRCYGM